MPLAKKKKREQKYFLRPFPLNVLAMMAPLLTDRNE
jgi:hypothetical protein